MRAPRIAVAAATVLALEAVALVVFSIIEIAGVTAGDASSPPTAVALIVLTLIGALALAAFAFGTRAGKSLARSGGVVVQVLAVAIALAALTIHPVPWVFVLGVGLPGLLGFALLVTSARCEGVHHGASAAE